MFQIGESRAGIGQPARVRRPWRTVAARQREQRRGRQSGEVSGRIHLRGAGQPASAKADFVFLSVDDRRVGCERRLDMIMAGPRRGAGYNFEHVVGRIIRINDDLTVAMIAEHAPMNVARGGFKIAVLNQLLPRAIRVADYAYIIDQHFARIEEAEPKLIPKRGTELLTGNHPILHRLPDASATLVAVSPR